MVKFLYSFYVFVGILHLNVLLSVCFVLCCV